MQLPLLWREGPWAVVAKPPRWLVHARRDSPDAHVVVAALRDQLGPDVHLVHRLDRATSGCLLVSTDAGAVPEAVAALRAGTKTYIAQVRGAWSHPSPLRIERPLSRKGKAPQQAASTVRCLGRSTAPRTSLLAVTPHTGRWHQVRRHLRGRDHPILGDAVHGDTRVNRTWREQHGLERLALHCLRLQLPLAGGLDLTCPLFDDLQRVWASLPFWAAARADCPGLALPPLPAADYG